MLQRRFPLSAPAATRPSAEHSSLRCRCVAL
jgi:hypothetical protein